MSLGQEISEITGIPIRALQGQSLTEFSIDERKSWAASRTTTFEEDRVYCLLGMFGLTLPLTYGEGKERANIRLQDLLQRQNQHQDTREPYDSFSKSCV